MGCENCGRKSGFDRGGFDSPESEEGQCAYGGKVIIDLNAVINYHMMAIHIHI